MTAEEWLLAEDDASRSSRSGRLAFVVQASGAPCDMLIPGGFVPARALAEIKWCYINGQFLACIVLCQVMLEHVLAGQFALMGNDDLIRKGFKVLCDKALAAQLISPSEYRALTCLRLYRNPYVHPRKMDDATRVERRMLAEHRSLESIVEDDARGALVAVLRLMGRYPFSFESETEPSS